MAKKITIILDDDTASQIDELAKKTQIPKVRLAKQAYSLLFAFYKQLTQKYREDLVNLSLIDLLYKADRDKKEK